MSKVSNKALEKIKSEKVTPTPRWQFLMRDTFVWILFSAMVIIGSLSVSVILFLIRNADLDLYKRLERNPLSHLMMNLPYLWIAIFCFAFVVAMYSFRHSRKGYKYKILAIILLSVLLSGALGTIIFITKGGQIIHSLLIESMPVYQQMHHQEMMWNQPEKGLLAGKVIEVRGETIFILDDLERDCWEVFYGEAKIPPRMKLQEGIMVKIIGEQIGEESFQAEGIRPWIGLEIRNGEGKDGAGRPHMRIEMKEMYESVRTN